MTTARQKAFARVRVCARARARVFASDLSAKKKATSAFLLDNVVGLDYNFYGKKETGGGETQTILVGVDHSIVTTST